MKLDSAKYVVLEERADASKAKNYVEAALTDEDHLWVCHISPAARREIRINRLYWAMLRQWSMYCGHSSGELHRMCAVEFLGARPIYGKKNSLIQWEPFSTKLLASITFREYVLQVSDLAYRTGTPLIDDYTF